MYDDILVHVGRKVETTAGAATSAGRRVQSETPVDDDTPTFGCCLFLPPPAGQESERGQRKVKQPELLLPDDSDLVAEDQVEVLAAELTGPGFVGWQLTGDPQPFGPPGEDLVGRLARLQRVKT